MSGDGVECILNNIIKALREWFRPDSNYPPVGPGTERVRVFAGDAAPLSAVDMHNEDCGGCGNDPFLWIRLMRRYPTDMDRFPGATLGQSPCGNIMAVAIEVGIARCAAVFDDNCDWTAYESEAEISLDDSWRLQMALCMATGLLKDSECSDATTLDSIIPYGPEGGVIAWIGTLYVRVDS